MIKHFSTGRCDLIAVKMPKGINLDDLNLWKGQMLIEGTDPDNWSLVLPEGTWTFLSNTEEDAGKVCDTLNYEDNGEFVSYGLEEIETFDTALEALQTLYTANGVTDEIVLYKNKK